MSDSREQPTMTQWRERAGEVWTVPNLVTLARLPLVVGIVVLVDSPVRYVLFALVVFSDGFDGWLARRLDQQTELGALLDPALDKVTALVLVAALFPRTDLALAYLVLFFARDTFVVALAPLVPLCGFDTDRIKARPLGKVVTNLQFLAIVALLVPAPLATEGLLWALGAASALAVADYTVFVVRELTDAAWVEESWGVAAVYAVVGVAFAAVVALVLADELTAFLGAVAG